MVGVIERTADVPQSPTALADALYRAGGIALQVAAPHPVELPWRDRLHRLVGALIPTTASWSARAPRPELSAEDIEQVAALTDRLTDAVENRLGPVSCAFHMSSRGGDYRDAAPGLSYSYDIVWDDLLLVAGHWAVLLHVGLSD